MKNDLFFKVKKVAFLDENDFVLHTVKMGDLDENGKIVDGDKDFGFIMFNEEDKGIFSEGVLRANASSYIMMKIMDLTVDQISKDTGKSKEGVLMPILMDAPIMKQSSMKDMLSKIIKEGDPEHGIPSFSDFMNDVQGMPEEEMDDFVNGLLKDLQVHNDCDGDCDNCHLHDGEAK